jgi:hypothetical protein
VAAGWMAVKASSRREPVLAERDGRE